MADKAFSSGALGKGIAFIPKGDFICAPANGKVTALFPTGHAFGVTTKSGVEILVHIGINTVELNGKGFDVLVHQDDEVRAGEPVIRINRKLITDEGFDITTMLVITNNHNEHIDLISSGDVSVGDILNKGEN